MNVVRAEYRHDTKDLTIFLEATAEMEGEDMMVMGSPIGLREVTTTTVTRLQTRTGGDNSNAGGTCCGRGRNRGNQARGRRGRG